MQTHLAVRVGFELATDGTLIRTGQIISGRLVPCPKTFFTK